MTMKIYRDKMGYLQPNASISIMVIPDTKIYSKDKGEFIEPGLQYFYFHTTSDAPAKKWYFEKGQEEATCKNIIDDLINDGWDCEVIRHRGSNKIRRIDCVHIETKRQLDEQKKEEEKQLQGEYEQGFIRFGLPPKSGYSTNWATGETEPGVSVYKAKIYKTGTIVIDTPHYSAGTYHSLKNYPMYRVWGEIVGYGADGEPCLKIERIKLLKQ